MSTALVLALLGVAGTTITAGTNIFLTITGRKHEIKTIEMAEAAAESKIKLILFIIGIAIVSGFVIWSFYFIISQYVVSPQYQAETTVHYSAGETSEWAYAQQRKEYSIDEDCYLRVSTDVSASNLKGNNKDIDVTLIFTGADICDIFLFDGIAMTVEQDKTNNCVIYSYTQKAQKSNLEETEGTISIFKYHPKAVGNVSIKVMYGEELTEEFDVQNTISFINN